MTLRNVPQAAGIKCLYPPDASFLGREREFTDVPSLQEGTDPHKKKKDALFTDAGEERKGLRPILRNSRGAERSPELAVPYSNQDPR